MKRTLLGIAVLAVGPSVWAQTTLGSFTFDDALFGNTLAESDGGSFSAGNWLNLVNADPANPGYLTGANFDTGIANIGLGSTPVYTIGYSSPIFNGTGDDLGIIVARYSEDNVTMAVSTDGVTFGSDSVYGFATAVATGAHYNYYYSFGGPYDSELFVHPVDLSDFGVAAGGSISAVRVTGEPQLDLIRVAGFQVIPEPATVLALSVGVAALIGKRRRG